MSYVISNNKMLVYQGKYLHKPTVPPVVGSNVKYGRLYNQAAVSEANFAPAGWHAPTQAEGQTLVTYLINNGYGFGGSGNDIGKAFAHTILWNANSTAGNIGNDLPSNNTSGFSFLPNGARLTNGSFNFKLSSGFMWTVSDWASSNSWFYTASNDNNIVINGGAENQSGLGVRLIKNDSTLVPSLTDLDGNLYTAVKIGTQVWLQQNWACTKLNEGTNIPEVTVDASWTALTTMGRCNYNNDIANVFM